MGHVMKVPVVSLFLFIINPHYLSAFTTVVTQFIVEFQPDRVEVVQVVTTDFVCKRLHTMQFMHSLFVRLVLCCMQEFLRSATARYNNSFF